MPGKESERALPRDEEATLTFGSGAELVEWLERNHASSPGIWMRIARKDSGQCSVSYAEALEAAICYGWIDGQKRPSDSGWWLQRFTPRKPRSVWSRINRERAETLIAAGRMQPAGLKEVERARADGRWDGAYDSQARAGVPPDLQAALEASPAAAAFFGTLNAVNRYAILHRLQRAKKPETRARRLRTFLEMLERGEKIYP
jgi:uncharacterized protein YdeI (YjbR/CyaY-like superfamily)